MRFFRRDRVQNGRRGVGILIAVRDTLRASVRDVSFDSELLFDDIIFPANRKICLGVFHRPPNSSINCLLGLQTALDTVLSSSQNPKMVLVGDFNIPEFDWNTDCASVNSPNATFLSDIIHDNFLFQLVKDPTRNGNILDLVFVTSLDLVYDLKVGLPFSDHNSISMLLSRKSFSGRKSQKLSYSFKKADWNHLRNLLYYTPWHCAFMDTDIDCIWAAWSDMFLSAVNECIPRRTVKRTSNAPWISGDLIKLCRRKKVLYKRAKKTCALSDWNKYRKFNNYVKKECNSARRQFINNLADELKTGNSSKPFWNFVQSKRKVKCDLASLKVNDSYLNDDLSIANCMNSYFSSVFTVEDHENFPDLEYITDEKLCNIFCSATEVEKLLRNLNIYKSPGPDYISPRILRECAQVLSSPLALFLNTSFSQGQLPSIWKSAHITPVHKKGSKNLMENYRQISLTCIVCKIAEAVVKSRVVDFWSDLNLFNPDQFAYLRGKSTLAQLLTCYND